MSAATNIINIKYTIEHFVLCALLASALTLGGLYVYFLSVSVHHVVISKELEEKTHTLHSEIATLEAAYMEKQHAISVEVVADRGYLASQEKVFLDRGDSSIVTRR